ncbi:hypothetical protein [Gynuella sp.]|uniref:hypothetical protein n=1 Tax=Gynuella sp. TaxID=2969146 RepID=UPI003D0F8F90
MTLRTFLLGLMLTVGWLGAVFTGGCTLFFVFEGLSGGPESQRYVSLFLLVGGVPFIGCVLLIIISRYISKRSHSNEPPNS